MLTIAILDDGICPSSFPSLGPIDYAAAVAEDGTIFQADEPDRMTHGTLCAAIVRAYAPDAAIISIKVLDPETRKGTIRQIRYALEWCVAHDVSLINLSVGSISLRDRKYLQPVIASLARHNIPLVCACSNNETPSIFTEFSWSVSVEKEAALSGDQYRPKNGSFLEGDFCASSTHTLITSDNISKTFFSQNSHAAPVITAKIYQLLKAYGKLPPEALRRLLRGNASESGFHIKPLPDFMDTAMIIGSLPYPQDLLTFSRDAQKEGEAPVFLAVFPDASLDAKRIKETIRGYAGNLRGLLYAGTAPAEIKEIAGQTGCLFWDESEYRKAAAGLPSQPGSAETLKLLFRGSGLTAARLALLLQEKLIENGYRCKTFSDLPQAYCLGMIFLTAPVQPAPYIDTFIHHDRLDIVLICSNCVDLDYDMVISCREGAVRLEYDGSHREYDTDKEPLNRISSEILTLLL